MQNGNAKLGNGLGGRQVKTIASTPAEAGEGPPPTQYLLDPLPAQITLDPPIFSSRGKSNEGGGSIPITNYSKLGKATRGAYVHQTALPRLINLANIERNFIDKRKNRVENNYEKSWDKREGNRDNHQESEDSQGIKRESASNSHKPNATNNNKAVDAAPTDCKNIVPCVESVPCPVLLDNNDKEEAELSEEETEEQENEKLRQEMEREKEKMKFSQAAEEGYMLNSAGYVQTPSPLIVGPDWGPVFPTGHTTESKTHIHPMEQNYVPPEACSSVA